MRSLGKNQADDLRLLHDLLSVSKLNNDNVLLINELIHKVLFQGFGIKKPEIKTEKE